MDRYGITKMLWNPVGRLKEIEDRLEKATEGSTILPFELDLEKAKTNLGLFSNNTDDVRKLVVTFVELHGWSFEVGESDTLVKLSGTLRRNRHSGEVKWFDDSSGHGFIRTSEGAEIFFHRSELKGGRRWLATAEPVNFRIDVGDDNREFCAAVRSLKEPEDGENLRRNPRQRGRRGDRGRKDKDKDVRSENEEGNKVGKERDQDSNRRKSYQGRPDIRRSERKPRKSRTPGMHIGSVKWFDPEKKFGFITQDSDDEDIFVHADDISGSAESLEQAQRVEFFIKLDRKDRRHAVAVSAPNGRKIREPEVKPKRVRETEPKPPLKVDSYDLDEEYTGKCKWFNIYKEFGYITIDGTEDEVFVHASELKSKNNLNRSLAPGEEVQFKITLDNSGRPKAEKVTGPNGEPVKGIGKKYRAIVMGHSKGDIKRASSENNESHNNESNGEEGQDKESQDREDEESAAKESIT